MTADPRYIVGIDLGTTNCAVAYIDTARSSEVLHFPIPQVSREAAVSAHPTLPSFLYLPGPHDLPEGSLSLPWEREPAFAVGQFARVQGARIPGRLVSSAKSWLCHAEVDRQAAILPWDGLSEVQKISPVEAASRYLLHLRQAWLHEMGKAHPLEEQHIILTVPASFDEVARELTVEAAGRAGLSQLTLLEEPQAALYAWLVAHSDSWQTQLKPGDVILVCDVGGGTTDLSLMTVTPGRNQLGLERVAVGDHLLEQPAGEIVAGVDSLQRQFFRSADQRIQHAFVRSGRHLGKKVRGDLENRPVIDLLENPLPCVQQSPCH